MNDVTIKDGKLHRNGQVAALYSPGFGAGWSTWSIGDKGLYCPELAMFLLEHGDGNARNLNEAQQAEFMAMAKRIFPDEYCGGARDLRIEWMTPGTQFRVTEYDGSESIEYPDATDWNQA